MRRRAGEEGAVLVLVALFMVVLLGFCALTIDVGNAMLHKRRLQSAVDLAILSASQKLPDTATAAADAQAMAAKNWATRDTSTLTATTTTGCKVAGCAKPDKITLDATADVPTGFAGLFGVSKFTVHARGAACGPCDTSTRQFDVVVVLDRSFSMCLDSSNAYNSCYDIKQAVDGVKSLLGFFDPANDRVGLAVLSSGDSRSPFAHTGAAYPCDTADINDASSSNFKGTVGDFMDGTPADHDSWLLAPLAAGFKKADGSLNTASPIVTALNCIQPKYWTPIAPAIQAASQELATNGRKGANVDQVIVFLGDGGANAQPMKRDASGNPTTTPSWYTPSSAANNLKPCHDAVGQAAIAKAAGVDVYTIGYDLNASSANVCYSDNHPQVPAYVESGIDARTTLQSMATDSKHFFEKATAGDLTAIFNAIGRNIVSGGSRLVE